MSPPNECERQFVEYLQSLVDAEDRAALAALRRGLGKPPGSVADLFPYVVPFAPADGPRWHEEVFYLVAALFSAHQRSWPAGQGTEPTNLGASFRRLAEISGSAGIERRFIALLNARSQDLPEHLRHAISILKAHEVPVDWARLLHDLRHWDHQDRFIQRDWARAFWRDSQDQLRTAGSESASADAVAGTLQMTE